MDIKKYILTISEPSDFESQDGKGHVKGRLLQMLSNGSAVFKSNHVMTFGPISGDILLLNTRSEEGNDFRNINDGATVNGSLLKSDYDEDMDEEELNRNVVFVLVGVIEEDKSPEN